MDFELTISGLWVLAIKTSERRSTTPDAVDIIIPAVTMAEHRHRARLSYDFNQFDVPEIDQELMIGLDGSRFTSLALDNAILNFEFVDNPYTDFALQWGPEEAMKPPFESWMNWIPSLEEIGFGPLILGSSGKPNGASVRITLPKGELACRNLPRDADTSEYLVWDFPATDDGSGDMISRSVANEVVFRTVNVGPLTISDDSGKAILKATQVKKGTVKMCISNDLVALTRDTPRETAALDHLEHLDVLDIGGEFQAPELSESQRTGGGPVCNGVISLYDR
jgi:hypothetical protein